MTGELELAKAVGLIRDELLQAAAAGAGQDVRFEVGPISMEFTVELRADARAGFKAWVVSGDAGVSRASTHTVTLTLTPSHADGRPVQVSDDTAKADGERLFRLPEAD